MSHTKGFGTGSNSNGQFWYGDNGFLYKKNTGSGARKNPSYGLICNQPTFLYNKYKPGTGGVGASSVANRRAKNRYATVCNNGCGNFYNYLGLRSVYPIMPIHAIIPNIPIIPISPILEGTFIFSFNLQPQLRHMNKDIENIPIPLINRNQLTYTKNITQVLEKITVTINYTYDKELSDTDNGFSFYKPDNSIIEFYNNNTSDLTINSFGKIPLSRLGNQFTNLKKLKFSVNCGVPTILPNTSLKNCFENISDFNCSDFTSTLNLFASTEFISPL